ncbi:MAG: DUF3187 family protein, partial [Candidatus Polarisedimenticolia bacterium]
DDPFPVRNQLPFHLPFLDQTPAAARTVGRGRVSLRVHLTHENTFAATDALIRVFDADDFATWNGRVTRGILEAAASASPDGTAFILDGETTRAVFDVAVGLTPRLDLELSIPLLRHGGGFMDGAIDWYHERLGFPDAGRRGFERGLFLAGYAGDGESLFLDRQASGIGDAVVSVRALLIPQGPRRPALAGGAALKLPTGNPDRLLGSGSTDLGASITLSHRRGRTALHGGYQHDWLGRWDAAPNVPLDDSRSLFAAWAFTATPRSALVVQLLRSRGVFPHRRENDLGRTATEAAVGMRHRVAEDLIFEWSLLENLARDYNTPDFGAFFGLTFEPPDRSGARP